MMKLVHTADWHIGKNLNDYSLLEDQRDWFLRFVRRLEEIRPDALVIAGDLYDRSVPSREAVSLCSEILSQIVLELGIETFVIAGNHDSRERLSFGSSLLEKEGLHIAGHLNESMTKIPFQEADFYLLPYLETHDVRRFFPNEPIRRLEEAIHRYTKPSLEKMDKSRINILVAHGFFSCMENREDSAENSLLPDAQVGGSEQVDAAPFLEFDYAALGHLHSRRRAGGKQIWYSGSPLKYSIDEAHQEKSFQIVELEKGMPPSIAWETLPPVRDVRILEGSFEELMNPNQYPGSEDYVFLHLTDPVAILNAISHLKGRFPNCIGLKYINRTTAQAKELLSREPQLQKMDPVSLFADFYRHTTQEELPESDYAYLAGTLAQSEAAVDSAEERRVLQ